MRTPPLLASCGAFMPSDGSATLGGETLPYDLRTGSGGSHAARRYGLECPKFLPRTAAATTRDWPSWAGEEPLANQ